MTDYMGWAVRRVESKATTPRFQVGTIRGVIGHEPPPAGYVPSESERRIMEHRDYEAKQRYGWEWGHHGDRSDAALELFRKGIDEATLDRMLDAAAANPGKVARHMLGTGTIEMA